LAGRRPFAADTPTAEAAAHIHAPVPSIHEANASLPPQLDRVSAPALAKEPRARYETAGEFVADLRAALDEAAGATASLDDAWPSLAPAAARPATARPATARPATARPVAATRRLERGGG